MRREKKLEGHDQVIIQHDYVNYNYALIMR
jgi:hypothetical protein